jgi:NADPH:quinone reductase-like Zn-dependent oxidoreductase
MQAIVCRAYGSPDVLKLEEVRVPVPQDNEVLIKIVAASAAAGDWHIMRAKPFLVRLMFGLRRPKHPILGADVAGRVEAVGKDVTHFRPGDEVFGDLSNYGFGAFAEYVAAPEGALAHKPAQASFEQAAAMPVSALTALQALRDHGQVQAGQKVLINGASGGVGTFAVQIAKALGAEVTAVCSTSKMALMRSLGADHVIDYTQEDFTQSGERYDVIIGVNGYQPLSAYQRALAPQGRYVMVGGSTRQMVEAMTLGALRSRKNGRKMGNMLAKASQADLQVISEMFASGAVKPVIDRCFPLAETPDAIRYLEEGHAKGKIIIMVEKASVRPSRTESA